METVVLYCKSYSKDLLRIVRLAKSVAKFNNDKIPFYVSVPERELELFQEHLSAHTVMVLSDEEIISEAVKAAKCSQKDVRTVPVHLMQQIIKAEFWRVCGCKNYVVIDSDSYFIRPFETADFLWDVDMPYTVMHEGKELLQYAARRGMTKVRSEYIKLRKKFQNIFGRHGRYFDFGPTPVIWSASVWDALRRDYAEAKNTNIFEMIRKHPCELMWYGEYLLYSKCFPIMPIEPLFKVYHYKDQFEEGWQLGENEKTLSENFFGIVMQSNWERSLDFVPDKKSAPSRLRKKVWQ